MVQEWSSRDHHPRHFTCQPPARYQTDIMDHRRFYESQESVRHQPPMAIDTALRSHCGIWAKQYFVAVVMDDGTPATFFSPGQKLQDSVVRQFFDIKKFQQVVSSLDTDQATSHPPSSEGSMYFRPPYNHRHHTSDRTRSQNDDDGEDGGSYPGRPGRKRPRSRQTMEYEEMPMPIMSRRGIRVCDSRALWGFYDQRFKSCQQSACKLIAKAWVKAVEPKKQSTHPYTGSDAKAPDWWPKPWGDTKEDRVRHKEPDHLYKRERVHLLNHILAIIVEPTAKQHPDVRKLHLNVKKLEECTNEALSGFFSENPQNSGKKRFLSEIFKVAKQQERYKNGEIDAATEVYVLNDDRVSETQTPEQEEVPASRDHEEQNTSPSTRSTAQGFHPTSPAGHSPTTASQTSSFVNEMPMRNTQNPPPPPSMVNDLTSSHHGFVEEGLPVHGTTPAHHSNTTINVDMIPNSNTNDSSRRSSVFGEYSHVGNGMYTQPWQTGSTASNPQAVYSHKQNGPSTSFVTAVPSTPPPSYMRGSFVDTMTQPGYDPTHSQVYRSGDVPSGQIGQQQTYNYMPNDSRGLQVLPGVSEVIDSVPRGHFKDEII
ncbi:hypothetical protein V2G26_020835 [Clonostachys chloroleuca]|uniref:Subtelomeric hrmA-associated cluster protein AFUB-079030/YDR124W-like helical bundle domain-containing protein n=1 Tax=Clonostachys chloroleuca TaxID=1926264 RepID=A0AA35PZ56_9HYPO|nr:unnamed protein product [Clonostachys chloroleuca]